MRPILFGLGSAMRMTPFPFLGSLSDMSEMPKTEVTCAGPLLGPSNLNEMALK